MDGHRFDDIVRQYATGASRRTLLAGVAGAILTALALPGRATAEPNPTRCRRAGRNCSKDDQCCSRYCRHSARLGHGVCAACESSIICGETCCPEDAVNGCTTITGPNGPVATCLCPDGALYDPSENVCRGCADEDGACATNDECCSDTCCDGTCCADGTICCGGVCGDGLCCGSYLCDFGEECCRGGCCPLGQTCTADGRCAVQCDAADDCPGDELCCGGICTILDDCVCPPGTSCAGISTCRSFDTTVTTGRLCCSYPQASFCCANSHPDANDGESGCCTPGVDCPSNGRCIPGVPSAQSLVFGCCLGQHPDCGPDGDCCFHDIDGGENITGELTCILPGDPCRGSWPCCSGVCDDTVCACIPPGEPHGSIPREACCSGETDINGEYCL